MKKKEMLFISAVLVLALVLWAGMSLFRREDHGSVTVSVDGKEFGTYSLNEDQTIAIHDTNTLEIKDGSARMIDARCPDHLCMKQKAIDISGGVIVCLPNKVMIEGKK